MASAMAQHLGGLKRKGTLRGKKKQVNLGSKGSFTIRHPGWTRAKAAAAGMSTREWAQKHSGDAGVAGKRARSALGLMAMGHKK